MKIRTRFWIFILALVIAWPALAASAAETQTVYKSGDALINAATGSAEAYQGINGWRFQTELDGVYTDYNEIGQWSWISPVFVMNGNDPSYGCLTGGYGVTTNGERKLAYAFTLPQDGTFTLESENTGSNIYMITEGASATFAVYKENADGVCVKVWPADGDCREVSYDANGNSAAFHAEVAGKQGEKLRFLIGNAEAITPNVIVSWNPIVTCSGEYDDQKDPHAAAASGEATFVAPEDGVYSITPAVTTADDYQAGSAELSIQKNGVMIWPMDGIAQTVKRGGANVETYQTFYTAMKAGEQLTVTAPENAPLTVSPVKVQDTYASEADLGLTLYLNDTGHTHKASEGVATATEFAVTQGDAAPVQGKNGWYFQVTDGSSFQNMNQINPSWSWISHPYTMGGSGEYGCMAEFAFTPDNATWRHAYTYVVSQDGVYTLGAANQGKIYCNAEGEYSIAVYKLDKTGKKVQVWPQGSSPLVYRYDESCNYVDFSGYQVACQKGEKLSFVIGNQGSSVNSKQYSWNPTVTHAGAYNADQDPFANRFTLSDGYSDVQGANGWSYQYAAPGDDVLCNQPMNVNAEWRTSASSFYTGVIAKTYMMPGTDFDSVLTFTAPYSGSVEISIPAMWLEDSTGTSNPGDGVKFGVFLRSEGETIGNVYPGGFLYDYKTIENGGALEFTPVTLAIRKGQKICFRVNMGDANNWHDVLSIQPEIRYTTIDRTDEGVGDGEGTAGRTALPIGSTLDSADYPMVGRSFPGDATPISAADFLQGLQNQTLSPGKYEITDQTTLTLGSSFSKKLLNASGICVKVNVSDSVGVCFDGITDARLTGLTVEIAGSPSCLVETRSVDGLELQDMEVIYTGSGADVQLLETTGTCPDPESVSLILNGLRFEGRGVKGILLGNAVASPAIKNSFLSGLTDYAVRDQGAVGYGVCLQNNVMGGDILLTQDNAVVRGNTLDGNVNLEGTDFALVAANRLTGTVSLKGAGCAVVRNAGGALTMTDCGSCSVVDNEEMTVTGSGVSNSLFEQNSGGVTVSGGDNFGGNLYDQTARATVGVNENLLPKIDNTLFRGVARRAVVNDGGTLSNVNHFVAKQAMLYDTVILAPGAYRVVSQDLSGQSGLTLYGYHALLEATDYHNFILTVNGSKNVKICGLTLNYAQPANGQGTVVEVGETWLKVIADPGFIADLSTAEGNYTDNAAWEAFHSGSKLAFSNLYFTNRSYDSASGLNTLYTTAEIAKKFVVGDKLTVRGSGDKAIYSEKCANVTYEDMTLHSSSGFAYAEFIGDGNNKINRWTIIPDSASILDADDVRMSTWKSYGLVTEKDGVYYGPEHLVSTCDATHSIGMRVGPQVTNSIFLQMTDDAANVNGCYSFTKHFDSASKTLTYSAGAYGANCVPFRTGDTLVLFTTGGRAVATAKAASNTKDLGNGTYSVVLDQEITLDSTAVVENLSANGNGFLYDNCIVGANRSRGLLVKAHDGVIRNCEIRDTAMSAILVKPELEAGWSEVGYTSNLQILNNKITGSSYDTGKDVLFTPINISGDGQNTTDVAYQLHNQILISGNVITDYCSTYAINIDAAQQVQILNNTITGRRGVQNDAQSPIRVSTSTDVEIAGNTYPAGVTAQERVDIELTAKNVHGADVTIQSLSDVLLVESKTIYTDGAWYLKLDLTNKGEEKINVTIDQIKATAGLIEESDLQLSGISAGETKSVYLPIQTLPQNMTPAQATADVSFRVSLENGTTGGMKMENLSFHVIEVAQESTEIETLMAGAERMSMADGSGLSAQVRIASDMEFVYVWADVTDVSHHQSQSAPDSWAEDGIQLGFDPGRDNGFASAGQCELGFALDNAGNILKHAWSNTISTQSIDTAEASIVRDNETGHTMYQIKLPWSLVGANGQRPGVGQTIGFNLVVNNVDGAGQERSYLELFGGIATNKNASNFGAFTMANPAAPAGEGYTAGVNSLTTDLTAGETVTVNVAVNHSSDTQFAAAELTVNYDSEKLTYTGASLDASKVDASVAGTLKLADYGENKNFGNAVYTLNFTARAEGQAAVTLTGAAFSDQEGAVGDDLVAATLSPAAVTVTISEGVHKVELPAHFAGAENVVNGGDYTFTLNAHYTCENVTATVNGAPVEVTKNEDGSYTVKNVTGELVISGTAAPKSYSVSITGTTAHHDGTTAAYGTDYTFTLPADVPVGIGKDGVTYSAAVTIGGEAYHPASDANRKYTIAGADVCGDIVITVTATPVPAGQFSVTVNGEDAAVGAEVVVQNGTATLTLTPEAGYTYQVTATMGGQVATVTAGDNHTYTVSDVTGNVVFTVTKQLVTAGISVAKYATLDGTNMWLVKFSTTLSDEKVPTYQNEKMFWSAKYEAYCYLVIADDLQTETAKGLIAVTADAAAAVDYGMDVNMTGKVDANDAQLVYDIYKALYKDFDTVSMEKFLRADVNADGIVDTKDATAIISAVLTGGV